MGFNHTADQIERGQAWSQVSRKVNVGTTWTLAAKANSQRRWLMLQNVADEYIEVLFADSTPSSSADGLRIGILDAANRYNDGTRMQYSEVLGNLDRRALYAKCASGSKALLVVEAPTAETEAPAGYSSSSSSSSSLSSSSSSSTSTSSQGLSSSSSSSSSSTSTSTTTSSSSLGFSSSSSSSSTSTSTSSSEGLSSSSSSYSSLSSSSSSSSGP